MFATIRKLVLTRVVPGILVTSIGAYTSARIIIGSPEALIPQKCKRHSRMPRNKRKKERQ
jgi:hypothetical protein